MAHTVKPGKVPDGNAADNLAGAETAQSKYGSWGQPEKMHSIKKTKQKRKHALDQIKKPEDVDILE